MNKTKKPTKLSCPGCGVLVEDGARSEHPYIGANAGCWALYGQVLAKEYEDPTYFKNHRLTVDAYAIQHPGVPERRAIQSVNVHLISLAMIFEKGTKLDEATKAMGPVIAKYKKTFEWLEPPKAPYKITVLDILTANDPETHCAKIYEWAKHTWEHWTDHHETILSYIEQ